MVAENSIVIKPFTETEIAGLVNTTAEELTYDKTFDFFYELIQADKEAMKDGAPLDKMLWLVRHAFLSGFERGIKLYNEMIDIAEGLNGNPLLYQLMETAAEVQSVEAIKQATDFLKGQRRMKIDDIKIFPCFSAHPPKQEKMESKEQYFRDTGCLQSEIVLDGAGNLIDGYTSYLVAKAHGLDSVPVRYGRRQIVRASHRKGGKLYAWELPGLLVDRVSVGEKLVVRTSRGLRTVTVAEVE